MGFLFVERKEENPSWTRRAASVLYRLAFGHHNQVVILQNHDDRQQLETSGFLEKGKARIIPGSGVKLDEYRGTRVSSGPVKVLLAARLLRDKGVFEYIEAAKSIRRYRDDVEFVLAGSLDPDNPAAVSETELSGWLASNVVEYVGFCSNMPELLSGIDIVVLPSYREGMPKVLLEAAAAGKPVVTTDVPGCRDAIEPNETGILVPARDSVSLTRAIERLVERWGAEEAHDRAREILTKRRDQLRRIADCLLEQEVLEGDPLRELLGLPPRAKTAEVTTDRSGSDTPPPDPAPPAPPPAARAAR